MSFDNFVNPPITPSSTIYFKNLLEFKDQSKQKYTYGRHGNLVKEHLCEFISNLELGYFTELYSSGLQAITCCLSAVLTAGDNVLAADNIYEPTKAFLKYISQKLNITVTYAELYKGDVVRKLDFSKYDVVFLEPVGSMTLEACNLTLISELCRKNNVVSIADNTWSAGISCNPLSLGFDFIIHSCTKFMSGGSDIFMGSVTCLESNKLLLQEYSKIIGNYVAQSSIYELCQRVSSLNVRYKEQNSQCLAMIKRLQTRFPLLDIFYPALDPNFKVENGYAIAQPGSLFSFLLQKGVINEKNIFEKFKTLKIGYSWGGSKPIMVYTDMQPRRLNAEPGYVFRISVGLNEPENRLFEEELTALLAESTYFADNYYFAYGSCMSFESLSKTLQQDVSSIFEGAFKLQGYKLVCNYPSTNGQDCFLNIEENSDEEVWGGLFKIDESQLHQIRIREAYYKQRYSEKVVVVKDKDGNSFKVLTYIANVTSAEEGNPGPRYAGLVTQGLVDCGLPTSYQDNINSRVLHLLNPIMES
jgi:cystathionine beta-lyase